jgi:hypothetical protein
MTHEEQLFQWLCGNSMHDIENDRCCPDFSCCHPELKEEIKVRKLYYTSFLEDDYDLQDSLLIIFLGKAMSQNTRSPIIESNIEDDHSHSKTNSEAPTIRRIQHNQFKSSYVINCT